MYIKHKYLNKTLIIITKLLIFNCVQHLNSEPRPESSKRIKHRTPYDELSDIFQLIGQHENTDEVSHSFKLFNFV